jgi:hypothetical protein
MQVRERESSPRGRRLITTIIVVLGGTLVATITAIIMKYAK